MLDDLVADYLKKVRALRRRLKDAELANAAVSRAYREVARANRGLFEALPRGPVRTAVRGHLVEKTGGRVDVRPLDGEPA